MINFIFEGKTYRLEFERRKQNVTVYKNGKERVQTSTYPYTKATLVLPQLSSLPTEVATATVGCSTQDKFSLEKGRLEALKALSKNINRIFKPEERAKSLNTALWDAYIARNKPSKREEPSVVVSTPQLPALPPALSESVH